MNEYLYEISISPNGETLNDEEIRIAVCRKTLRTNRKKKSKKEKLNYGKESDYNFYSI